jgi:hypothetical protein
MGFNKLFLPEIDYLQKQLDDIGEIEFGKYWLRRFQKSDATIGSTESYGFIKPFADFAYNESKLIFVKNETIPNIKK